MSGVRRYRVVRPIGRGVLCTVYQIEELDKFGKIIASRAMELLDAGDEETLERARAMVFRLRNLRMPGVVRGESLVRFQDRWAVLRELVDGVDLAAILARHPVPPPVAAEVTARLAVALNAAYGAPGADGRPQRLMHGAVRPSNVLLSADGHVWLLHLGMVAADPTGGRGRGSANWDFVAPERWRGTHDRAGEVYSLGTVFYEMLTGELYGQAPATQDEASRRLPRALSRLARHGEDTVALVGAMLAFHPEERPTFLEVERRCYNIMGSGRLRPWCEEVVPAVRQSLTAQDDDPMCNTIFEALGAGPDDAVDEPVQAWDDVTSSYPVGALRSRYTPPPELPLDPESSEAPPPPPPEPSRALVIGAVIGGALLVLVAMGVVVVGLVAVGIL